MDPRVNVPTDAETYPTLTDAGREVLRHLREHPAAPRYRNESGNRLLADEVSEQRAYVAAVADAAFEWTPGTPPPWLDGFVAQAVAQVPHWRAVAAAHGAPPAFADLPTTSRADFAADIARFVPDDVPLDRLINFRTTGTTGHPLLLPSHPRVAGRYLAYHLRALRRVGLVPRAGRGDVGVMLLGLQQRCFTYVSVTPAMDESGLAKINLHPDDWHDPADRARYVDAMAPEFIAGDPISFAALLELPVTHRPRALLSVSMALAPALRARLEARFGCPLLDLYSMNEAGPIAVHDAARGHWVLLQPGLLVEILDDAGRALPPGGFGEIALTGGFNFCLPLLRYRTGDYAALQATPDGPVLVRLQGRRPVRYRTADDRWINNIDLTHALAALPLSHYAVHQHADGAVTLRLPARDAVWAGDAAARLAAALGGRPVAVAALDAEGKVLQYTTAFAGGLGA